MAKTYKSLNWEILRLSIPNILSNISVPFLRSVDTLLMGRVSTLHLAAVGLGGVLFNFIFWNFGFLRMSTTGLTAKAYGRDDKEAQRDQLFRGAALALAIAVVLLLLQRVLLAAGLFAFTVPEDMTAIVSEYFNIRIWAAPATLLMYVGMGWFFGQQNSIFPLIVTIVVNSINIGLSVYFVRYLGWSIQGVALGTLIAEYCGIALIAVLVLWRYRHLLSGWRSAFESIDPLIQFLKINSDIFIRTFSITFVFAFFYRQSLVAGVIIQATNTVLLQFLNWMSYYIDGFAYAAESLIGKYAGAKDTKRGNRVIKYIFIWGMVLAAMFSVTYWDKGYWLLQQFSNDPQVWEAGKEFLPWMIILPIIGTPSYLWDGIYVGLTASKAMRNSMVFSLVIYLITYFVGFRQIGVHALWLAMLVFLAVRGIVQWWLWQRDGWELK